MQSARNFAFLACSLVLCACESTAYYAQAVGGHAGILIRREPIERVISNKDIDENLRNQLQLVLELRSFAGEELSLPLENQYETYVELDSRYAVWNIFAAPELSLEPKLWCYPVVGCAAYRGYYDRDDAAAYGEGLEAQGYDVYLGGVTAYSTLGWFNDPVLSTFVNLPEPDLANLLFHELAHQVLYVEGDTMFNESFATVVAREGVRRWLVEKDDHAAWQSFLQNQSRQQQFLDIVTNHRTRLGKVYESGIDDMLMRENKAEIIDDLRQAHDALKTSWGGQSVYDGWFAQDINNAQLNAVAAYYSLGPALEALLMSVDNDLQRFYEEARHLSELELPERHARLAEMVTE